MWKPLHPNDLTNDEKCEAMESLKFLSDKRHNSMKGQVCFNRNMHRSYIPKEGTSSPTSDTESVPTTSVMGAKKGKEATSCGTQSPFVQTGVLQSDERIIMDIIGELADMLLEIDSDKYQDFVIGEGCNKVSCARDVVP